MRDLFDGVDPSHVPAIAVLYNISEEKARKLIALTQFVSFLDEQDPENKEKGGIKK